MAVVITLEDGMLSGGAVVVVVVGGELCAVGLWRSLRMRSAAMKENKEKI